MLWFLSIVSEIVLNCGIPVGRSLSPAWAPPLAIYAKVVTARPRMRPRDCRRRGVASITDARPGSLRAILHDFRGALGGTRTPTMLLTATSRQRVYQFRHERLGNRHGIAAGPDQRRRCNKSGMEGQGLRPSRFRSSSGREHGFTGS